VMLEILIRAKNGFFLGEATDIFDNDPEKS
jgi:hypothetical protein